MTWVIVALLLLAAFGPVLWLLPSARDRRLARMRTRARTLGLSVQVTTIANREARAEERVSAGGKVKTATVSCAAYRQPFVRPINHLPAWKVDRSRTPGAGPVAGWVWDLPPSGVQPAFFDDLSPLLARLPEDALAFEATRLDVACYWMETATPETAESAVNSLHSVLSECAGKLTVLNDRIEARENRDDQQD